MKYLIRIFVVIVVSVPLFVYSAIIIPCDPSPIKGGVSGDCTFPALITMANNIIKFCIILGTSIFAIVFMCRRRGSISGDVFVKQH